VAVSLSPSAHCRVMAHTVECVESQEWCAASSPHNCGRAVRVRPARRLQLLQVVLPHILHSRRRRSTPCERMCGSGEQRQPVQAPQSWVWCRPVMGGKRTSLGDSIPSRLCSSCSSSSMSLVTLLHNHMNGGPQICQQGSASHLRRGATVICMYRSGDVPDSADCFFFRGMSQPSRLSPPRPAPLCACVSAPPPVKCMDAASQL
jgi:hypothetical protein